MTGSLPERLGVFATSASAVQVTWSRAEPGLLTLACGGVTRGGDGSGGGRTVSMDGGPGAVTIDGLRPGTEHELLVDGQVAGRFTTLAGPADPELYRFATISDLHLGETTFGYLGTMRERPQPLVPYPIRATQAALREIAAWGAGLVVVKGDCTHDGRIDEWRTFGSVMATGGLPYEAFPGNHDARPVDRERTPVQRAISFVQGGAVRRWLADPVPPHGRPVSPDEGLASVGQARPRPVRWRDLDGIRIVLVDTTLAGRHLGSLTGAADEIVDAAADARRDGRAVFVAAHHYPMPLGAPHFWPPGVPSNDVGSLFDRLHAANPAAFYSAGHTHRHRRYDRAGVCCTEVGSPKDYPGTWAGYVVRESGITQVVWRVASPDVLVWTERSRRAALGLWGRWSPGRLADRCFHHPWPSP